MFGCSICSSGGAVSVGCDDGVEGSEELCCGISDGIVIPDLRFDLLGLMVGNPADDEVDHFDDQEGHYSCDQPRHQRGRYGFRCWRFHDYPLGFVV